MTTSAAADPARLLRPRGSYVAGVCAGTAAHLGLPVRTVRLVFVVAAFVGGMGLAAYGLLWAMTPLVDTAVEGMRDPLVSRLPRSTWLLLVGAVLLAGGAAQVSGALATEQAVQVSSLLPVFAVGAGAVLAWSQLDQTDRREGMVRVALGAVLAVTGVVVLIAREQGARILWDVLFATAAVLGGLTLVLGPWVMRFWQRYQAEQASRIRETERADIAAHLHDSVLQTLALIQRTDDPSRITQLARAQERELRSWLYGAPKQSVDSLAEAASAATHEVEDLHGVPVDLVVTGDRPLDEPGEALVAAMREALANAVRHGAPPVSAYVEIGPRVVEVFVRDHGPGFDLDAVPEDRLGVRESLFGRMERHGGSARIRRLDEGTEVSLALPVEPPAQPEAPDRAERPQRAERPEPAERSERAERSEYPDRAERPEQPETVGESEAVRNSHLFESTPPVSGGAGTGRGRVEGEGA